MRQLQAIPSALFLVTVLSSCATAKTEIQPKENGEFVIVATADSKSAAYDAAVAEATEHCRKQGRNFVMLSDSRTMTNEQSQVTLSFQCK